MKQVLRWLFAAGFWTIVISVLWVLVLRVVPPPVTWAMATQELQQGTVERDWVALNNMPRAMPMAVIAAEDQKFFDHFGFDMEAMEKAMDFNDRKKGKRVKGASTLSQQTAKNVFCWPGRTYLRKGVEAWFTLLIEVLWGKKRIIEVYLNIAETGSGRFGVGITAEKCFHVPASKLSYQQCALIAAVLPRPRKYNACSPSAYVHRRQAWIARQMSNLGDLFDPEVRQRMQEELERKEARQQRRKNRRK